MKISLRQLQVFTSIAQTQHMGRAASDLQLAQPTLSTELRRLERALGVVLFDRTPSGSILTDAGETLVPYARAVLSSVDTFTRTADRLAAERETVRLAASPSIVNRLVPELLSRLERVVSAPDVDVLEVATGGVARTLAEGRAEIGLGHFVNVEPPLAKRTIRQDPLFAISGAGYLPSSRPVDIKELDGLALLLWPREQAPVYYDAILAVCTSRGVEPRVQTIEGPLTGAHSYLLRTGEAFALAPSDFARETSRSYSIAPLDPPASVPLDVAWRDPASQGTASLLDALIAQVTRSV